MGSFIESKPPLPLLLISFHPGVFLFPPKQEVDITSVYQTGNDSLFYWFGSREIDAEMTLT